MKKNFNLGRVLYRARLALDGLVIGGAIWMSQKLAFADGTAADQIFDNLKDGKVSDDKNPFKDLQATTQNAGLGFYNLFLTIGILGILFSLIIAGISFAMNKSSQKKEENKSHMMAIAIGGIIIFGAMSIIGIFQSLGNGIAGATK